MMEEIAELRAKGLTKTNYEPVDAATIQRQMVAEVPIFSENEVVIE